MPNCALATDKQQKQLIETYYEDMTGDGVKEKIELFGVRFAKDTTYYKDIFITITSHTKEWKINYGGGYSPQLEFIDINHDHINDILFQSDPGGSGVLRNTRISTLKHGEVQDIPLPSQHVTGVFKDHFQIELRITPLKPKIIDISHHKADYIRLDIYNKEEKLLKRNMIPLIDPTTYFKPIPISKEKGFGLKSLQQINGAYQADYLGTVETLWYFENESWVILKTGWKAK